VLQRAADGVTGKHGLVGLHREGPQLIDATVEHRSRRGHVSQPIDDRHDLDSTSDGVSDPSRNRHSRKRSSRAIDRYD
jgi:hypothetical protein